MAQYCKDCGNPLVEGLFQVYPCDCRQNVSTMPGKGDVSEILSGRAWKDGEYDHLSYLPFHQCNAGYVADNFRVQVTCFSFDRGVLKPEKTVHIDDLSLVHDNGKHCVVFDKTHILKESDLVGKTLFTQIGYIDKNDGRMLKCIRQGPVEKNGAISISVKVKLSFNN